MTALPSTSTCVPLSMFSLRSSALRALFGDHSSKPGRAKCVCDGTTVNEHARPEMQILRLMVMIDVGVEVALFSDSEATSTCDTGGTALVPCTVNTLVVEANCIPLVCFRVCHIANTYCWLVSS